MSSSEPPSASAWRSAYQQLVDAFTDARAAATGTSGVLNLGFARILSTELATELADEFERRHPDCRVVVREHAVEGEGWDVWEQLRDGRSDALYYFNGVSEPGLRAGPVIDYKDHVLLVSRQHRLAGRASVTAEELADEQVIDQHLCHPASVMEQLTPSVCPVWLNPARSTSLHGATPVPGRRCPGRAAGSGRGR